MKDILGYEGLYSIDENGNVFSHRYQKFLKPNINKDGYLKVGLTNADGKRKTYFIHRLVALMYIPNSDELPVVDHIDHNRLNNSVENLRWVTVRENNLNTDWVQFAKKMSQAYYNKPEESRKEQLQKARQTSVQVCSKPVEMRDKSNHDIIIKTYPSATQAAIQEFGDVSKNSGISRCANGKQKSAHGYFWTFAPISTDTSCEEET